MKNFYLVGLAFTLVSFTSIVRAKPMEVNSVLNPERVTNYATFEELLAKSPNIKENFYYLYETPFKSPKRAWMADEYLIPQKTLEMYCKVKEGGEIREVHSLPT